MFLRKGYTPEETAQAQERNAKMLRELATNSSAPQYLIEMTRVQARLREEQARRIRGKRRSH